MEDPGKKKIICDAINSLEFYQLLYNNSVNLLRTIKIFIGLGDAIVDQRTEIKELY